jgi:hypothetical protein
MEDEDTETALGTMVLDTLSAKNKRANLDQNTTFMITDEDAFGRFAGHMITSENFTWHLQSKNLRVQALKFPVAKGISFDKFVTLKGHWKAYFSSSKANWATGFNNFRGENGVLLKSLELPSDNPAGGINFKAVTELSNPRSADLLCVQRILSDCLTAHFH